MRIANREQRKPRWHSVRSLYAGRLQGMDPRTVLIVQDTVGNEVLYRLRATWSGTYIDLTARDRQPLSGWSARIPERSAARSTARG